MADHDPARTGRASTEAAARPRVRIAGVVLSLVFLTVAVIGFTGNPFWLLSEGTPWILAGILATIGFALVAGSVPRRR